MGKITKEEAEIIRQKFDAAQQARDALSLAEIDLADAQADLQAAQDGVAGAQTRLADAALAHDQAESDFLATVQNAAEGDLFAPAPPAETSAAPPVETPPVAEAATDVPAAEALPIYDESGSLSGETALSDAAAEPADGPTSVPIGSESQPVAEADGVADDTSIAPETTAEA